MRSLAVVLAFILLALACTPISGDSGQVVINELMPAPNVDDAEFIELHNVGTAAVDVSGWCFVSGIDGCFPANTFIAPGGFLLMVQDIGIARQAWSIPSSVPLFEYSGGLKSGGETVTLFDAVDHQVDSVAYGTEGAWPSGPGDGLGSLERVRPGSPTANPMNWELSNPQPTPLSQNSVFDPTTTPLLEVSMLPPADQPGPGQGVPITAITNRSSSVQLTYQVNFQSPVTVTMATANGLGHSATIPGQSAGDLVRYRTDATANSGGETASKPVPRDSISYQGVVVTNPSVSSAVPIIEWFMDDADYNDLLANHRYDDVEADAVIAYNGTVYDGVRMRIRGNVSRSYEKTSWKVEMPDGYLFDMPGLLHEPVNEFALQRDWWPLARLGWDVSAAAGQPEIDWISLRQQRNGEFHGVGADLEVTDGKWRDRNGFDDDGDSFYKIGYSRMRPYDSEQDARTSSGLEKKEGDPNDYSDIYELTQGVALNGSAQLAFLRDNLDVPEVINYLAVISLIRHVDSRGQNYRIARDGDTGRWELILWDFDWILHGEDAEAEKGDRWAFPTAKFSGNDLYESIFDHPELEELFYRRMKTLRDDIFGNNQVVDDYVDTVNSMIPEYLLEEQRWDFSAGYNWRINQTTRRVNFLRDEFDDNTAPSGEIPQAQPANPNIDITTVEYDPAAGSDAEYIKLTNQQNTAIDVSGWSLDTAVEVTFTPGTVIGAGDTIIFAKDDAAFKAAHGTGQYLGGYFSGKLSNSDELLRLLDNNGSVVDQVNFG